MEHKDKLKDGLAHWRGIEPRPGFEDRVWSRIEAMDIEPVRKWHPADLVRGWTAFQPVYVRAAALLIGGFLGLTLTLNIPSPAQAHGDAPNVLRSGSISGAYAQLITEE